MTLVWLLRLRSDDVGRDVGVAVEGLFDDQLYRRLAELQQGRVYARRRHDQYRRAQRSRISSSRNKLVSPAFSPAPLLSGMSLCFCMTCVYTFACACTVRASMMFC